ncbi:MAG TPA: YcaO-like family protein [Pararhizobium sp.]|uniref:YcaO-like family protein n=1 Tax=Pararhizobium sp. TaxID=1977563 RepID=UPI002BAA257C|nr:YcaO-like family protein [Pararhizobium sp.]HTO34382.1 YcaO-like family protein [Pararhizobium sp.]
MTADDQPAAGGAPAHRICTASQTLSRVEPHLKNFGITRVARHTGLDSLGIPVWCAYAPNSRSIVVAQGKGVTDTDAKASAVMEALERAVAGQPHVDIITDTMNGLTDRGRSADPLPGLIARGQGDISPDETIEWVTGTNLLNGEEIFVPREAVILDRTRPNNRYWMSSDGLASGNNREEAILHGLLERIERDAYTLWQVSPANDRQARCVDAPLYGGIEMADILARVEKAGLILRLFDITSNLGIPCFTALLGPRDALTDKPPRYVEVTHGSGAHLSPSLAALRAVTEAAQSRLTYISGARDDVSAQTYRRPVGNETRSLLACKPQTITARPPAPVLPIASMITHLLDRLRQASISMAIAVSLSKDEWPFSVVKVLVPALENPEGHRLRRFGARAIARTLWS